MTDTVTGTGTPNNPWNLRIPPGTSDDQMYRDDSVDPPELVCQVGSTKLRYLGHLGLVELQHNQRNHPARPLTPSSWPGERVEVERILRTDRAESVSGT